MIDRKFLFPSCRPLRFLCEPFHCFCVLPLSHFDSKCHVVFLDVVQVVMVNAEFCFFLDRFITKIVIKCPGELIAQIWKLYLLKFPLKSIKPDFLPQYVIQCM